MNFKKSALSIALGTVLGLSATASQAAVIGMDFDGLFTMLDPGGIQLGNTSLPYYADYTWGYGLRTQISGTMSFDTATGSGSGTVVPFQFFNGGLAVASGVQFQAIGGGLMLGNMLFSWNGSDIATQIVLDGSGLFAAMAGGIPPVGATLDGAYCAASGACALPASDGIKRGKLPIGPSPIATSSFNTNGATGTTTTLGQLSLGADDGIGGTPMDNGPFSGYNANFDMTSVTVTSVETSAVPVPAAVWLFGSGLVGLAGIARRRKAS